MSGAVCIYRGRERQVSDSVSSVEKQGEAKARAVEVVTPAALQEGLGVRAARGRGVVATPAPSHEEGGGSGVMPGRLFRPSSAHRSRPRHGGDSTRFDSALAKPPQDKYEGIYLYIYTNVCIYI